MAENPYVNKVEYAGQTLMDLTGDTVTPSDVLNGATFHDRSGAPQTGNLITHDVYDGLDSSSASDALSAKQGKVLNKRGNLNDFVFDLVGSGTNIRDIIQDNWSTIVNNLIALSDRSGDVVTYRGIISFYNGETSLGLYIVFGSMQLNSPYKGLIIYTQYNIGSQHWFEVRYNGTDFESRSWATSDDIEKYGSAVDINLVITSNVSDQKQCVFNNWSNIVAELNRLSGLSAGIGDFHGLLHLQNGETSIGTYLVWGSINRGTGYGTIFLTHYTDSNIYKLEHVQGGNKYSTIAYQTDIPTVYDGLDSSSSSYALSAKQGKHLNDTLGYNCYLDNFVLKYGTGADVSTIVSHTWDDLINELKRRTGLTSGIVSFNGVVWLQRSNGTSVGSFYTWGDVALGGSKKGKMFITHYNNNDIVWIIATSDGSTFDTDSYLKASQMPKKIQAGDVVSNGDITTVTFPTAFTSEPIVVCTPYNSSTPKNWTRACCITSISTTGFSFVEMVRNQANTSFVCGTDHCKWIAIQV